MKISRLLFLTALLCSLAAWGAADMLHAAAKKDPKKVRVVSLYAAHTEILLRLGARGNLVGVSGQETYDGPETEGWKRPPVFSIRDDVEKFLAAKPDVVLVRPMHMAAGSRLVETLGSAGINVYSAQVTRAGDLYQYWRNLAALVGREAEAEALIADFDGRVAAYHQAAERRPAGEKPGVFLEAIHEQVKTFTPDSIPVWLVELAGGRNVADDAKPQAPGLIIADYGPERLLAKADQVDLFIAQDGPMNRTPLARIKKRNIYQPLRAFKTGRVYKMPEDLLARPTPSLLEGLTELAGLTGLSVSPDAEKTGTPDGGEAFSPSGETAPAPAGEPASTPENVELKVDLPPAD